MHIYKKNVTDTYKYIPPVEPVKIRIKRINKHHELKEKPDACV